MQSDSQRDAFLQEIKDYLTRNDAHDAKMAALREDYNLAQSDLKKKMQGTYFKPLIKSSGVSRKALLKRKKEHDLLLDAHKAKVRPLIQEKAKTAAERQAEVRKTFKRRQAMLRKMSGHSPYIGCVTVADSFLARGPNPSSGQEFDTYHQDNRAVALDNVANTGGLMSSSCTCSVQTAITPFSLHEYQHQHIIFVWDADRRGTLKAQGFLQLNAEWEIEMPFAATNRAAGVTLDASLEVIQRGALPHWPTPVRAIGYHPRIIDVEAPRRRWTNTMGYHDAGHLEEEIQIETSTVDIGLGREVGFILTLTTGYLAEGGGSAELDLANYPYEAHTPGVVFSIEHDG